MKNVIPLTLVAVILLSANFSLAKTDTKPAMKKAVALAESDPKAAEDLFAKIPGAIPIGWRLYIIALTRPDDVADYDELVSEYEKTLELPPYVEPKMDLQTALEFLMFAYLKHQEKDMGCIPTWLFRKHPNEAENASWVGTAGGFSSVFILSSMCPIEGETLFSVPEYNDFKQLLFLMQGDLGFPCSGTIEYARSAARQKWEYLIEVNIENAFRYGENEVDKTFEKFICFWGNKGVWEKQKVKEYFELREQTIVALQTWLEKNKSFPKEKALKYATAITNDASSGILHRFPVRILETAKSSWYQYSVSPRSAFDDLHEILPVKQFELNYMLHLSVLNHQPIAMIKALQAAGASLEKEAENETILAVGDADYLSEILSTGAAVDHANKFGKTALSYAAQMDYLKCAEVLVSNGADINTATFALEGNPDGYSSEHIFYDCYLVKGGKTPLMYACEQASLNMVKLLLKHGADASIGTLDFWNDLLKKNEIMTSEEQSEAYKLLSARRASRQ